MNPTIKNRIKQIKSGQIPKDYCKSAIGIIPKDWEIKKISAMSEVNPKSQELKDEFLYIDLESVINGKLVNENIIKNHNAPSRAQRVLEKNDIIFQLVRPYQQNNYIYLKEQPLQVVASTGYAQIRTNDFGYLYQYLNFSAFCNRVLEKCTGTNYPAISSNDFSGLFIALPSKRERDKISKILAKWDEAIELQERLIEKLEIRKKGLMQKLLKPKKDWNKKTLSEIGDFSKGNGISHDKLKNIGIPCIVYGDLYTKYHTKFYVSENFTDKNTIKESVAANKGVLLFTSTGETAEEIGKCVCYYGEETIYVGGDIFILQIKEYVEPLFVAYQQNLFSFIKQKAQFGQGHSVVHIRLEDIRKLSVIFPKIKEQKKIVYILNELDIEKQLHSQKLELFKKQRKALMQLLLTGTVRVGE
jgi:type I restriction enzyme S subunit